MSKKIFLALILFSFLVLPIAINASIVPCQNNCTINDFFTMLGNIYNFVVKDIATPLAIVAIIIGGVIMMTSAGNPGQFATGKKILFFAIVGLILAFGSYLIIYTILKALGYQYSL